MKRIIDTRGTGKTYKLLEHAQEVGGIVVCSHPEGMKVKAESYGFDNITCMSYGEYANENFLPGSHTPIFIDELEAFLIYNISNYIEGYTISVDN